MPNLIIPEVFADAVNAKLGTSLRIGRVAFNATPDVTEIMQYGETIHFPKFSRNVVATEVTKGVPLSPTAMDMTDTTAKIKHVAATARVYDVEVAQVKGRVMNEAVKRVADAMALKIDNDLVVAMDTDAVYKQATAAADAITADELMTAMGCFGDNVDTASFAGIVVNSRLLPSLLKMDSFTSVEKTYNKREQANGLIVDGVVGYFIGIPVILCNNGTYDTDKNECKSYAVKRNALGYILQKNINVEVERESKLLADNIIASALYAVKLLETDGVVVLRKTVA